MSPRRRSSRSPRRKSKPCNDNRHRCRQQSQPRFQSSQQFSIIAITNQSGTIKERYSYTAYGELGIYDASGTARSSSDIDNRITYTGREWDEVAEVYHFRARMYDPLSGRFLSRDPIGYRGDINLYGANRLANGSVDPIGLKFELDFKFVRLGDIIRDTGILKARATTELLGHGFKGDFSIFVQGKFDECAPDCYCAQIDSSKLVPFASVKTRLPVFDSVKLLWTRRMWNDVVGHEGRRIRVARKGYESLLEPAVDTLSSCRVCRQDSDDAEKALQNWGRKVLNNAIDQFFEYWENENAEISKEYDPDNMRDKVNGRWDGFVWRHNVSDPGPLDVPDCPPSDCEPQ